MKKIIGILTLNRVSLLNNCIRSLNDVLGENRKDYTIFVADDGSDGDCSHLLEYQNDGLIDGFYIGTRSGVASNCNRIIRFFNQEQGDILYILNDDITFFGNPFHLYEEALEKTDFHHFCYTDSESPNKASGVFTEKSIEFVEYELVSDGVCLVMDRKCIETIGGFNPAYYFNL
jgi:GT2 family glycosyltransferase